MSFTIGSLFDGSGGFPLAGSLCGIEPVWASEVEPYPIAVTRSRFPNMKHIGDISKVNGYTIEPVDIITFGSPCQDLSVAGKRAGLKHEENGDDETTRSGLFMEAVRIIKEMRRATNGRYPSFALWENVPGAFSSNRGEDFRTVLEELIKIVEPKAVMPPVPQGGWAYSDSYCGDGWSLAYRILDAQYIRTAQRRRRLYLVLDLRGERAREVLFERESLRWDPAQSEEQGEAIAAAVGNGADSAKCVAQYLFENHSQDTRYKGPLDVCPMLPAQLGTGGNNTPFVVSEQSIDRDAIVYAIDRAAFNQGANAQYDFEITDSGVNSTLVARGPAAVAYSIGNGQLNQISMSEVCNTLDCMHDKQAVLYEQPPRYVVRRLTPTECARLQGFPDKWGHPDYKDNFTEEEFEFWCKVRNEHAALNGKSVKNYTKQQMLKWYNKLHTDSMEYKMWGNGVALPVVVYCMEGIKDALEFYSER